jgi:hypothetical protein
VSKIQGTSTAAMIVNARSHADLRAAQLAIADSVNNDERLLADWEREANVIELLECLGLYRRF